MTAIERFQSVIDKKNDISPFRVDLTLEEVTCIFGEDILNRLIPSTKLLDSVFYQKKDGEHYRLFVPEVECVYECKLSTSDKKTFIFYTTNNSFFTAVSDSRLQKLKEDYKRIKKEKELLQSIMMMKGEK